MSAESPEPASAEEQKVGGGGTLERNGPARGASLPPSAPCEAEWRRRGAAQRAASGARGEGAWAWERMSGRSPLPSLGVRDWAAPPLWAPRCAPGGTRRSRPRWRASARGNPGAAPSLHNPVLGPAVPPAVELHRQWPPAARAAEGFQRTAAALSALAAIDALGHASPSRRRLPEPSVPCGHRWSPAAGPTAAAGGEVTKHGCAAVRGSGGKRAVRPGGLKFLFDNSPSRYTLVTQGGKVRELEWSGARFPQRGVLRTGGRSSERRPGCAAPLDSAVTGALRRAAAFVVLLPSSVFWGCQRAGADADEVWVWSPEMRCWCAALKRCCLPDR